MSHFASHNTIQGIRLYLTIHRAATFKFPSNDNSKNWKNRRIMMISLNSPLISLIILLYCSSLGLNSEEVEPEFSPQDSNSLPQNAPLCRIVRVLKRNLHEEFSSRFKEELVCNIDGNSSCQSVTCSSVSNETLSAGLKLHICDAIPNVEFWVDTLNESHVWSQSFNVKSEVQTVEIHPISAVNNQSSHKWYLHVYLSEGESRVRTESKTIFNYLLFNATIEYWSPKALKPIRENLVNTTKFPLTQLCPTTTDASAAAPGLLMLKDNSKNAGVGAPPRLFLTSEELSSGDVRISTRTATPVETTPPSSRIGKKCDQKEIFECGPGATCTMTAQGGICECLQHYVLAQNGSCIPRPVSPVDPTVQPLPSSSTNSTYSSALGAILSILTLLAIAAAVFFGTKHGLFSRIRSRLPLQVPVWPFGRQGTVDDQVNMVDPFSQEEDDPPLL